MSSLSWLDYSDEDRQKALDVIDLFKEKDTRDELGLGTIRDGIADLLFPGTSTIQTRARYFLFVPWICQNLERTNVPSDKIKARARQEEVRLMRELAEASDTDGLIGKEAGGALKRLPSNIYWNGLSELGIRFFEGSQDQYHRSLDRFYRTRRLSLSTDDGGPAEGTQRANWHPQLPEVPPDFPDGATFSLSRDEAEFLCDRVRSAKPGPPTLFAFLVDRGRSAEGVGFPWEHPQYGDLPGHLRTQLVHAQNFSEALHGAALLYNLMLGEASDKADRIDHYRKLLGEWAHQITSRWSAFEDWDRAKFWELLGRNDVKPPPRTKRFVSRWLDIVVDRGVVEDLPDHSGARDLIRAREVSLKRGRARLKNRRALDMWGGAAGTAQLDYRWRTVRVIVDDILTALDR